MMELFLGGWEERKEYYPESPAKYSPWELVHSRQRFAAIDTSRFQLGMLKERRERLSSEPFIYPLSNHNE